MRKYAVSIMCTLLALSLAVSSFAMSDTDSVYLASADTAAVDVAAGEEQTIPMLLAEEAATYAAVTYPRELIVVYQGICYRVKLTSATSYSVWLLSNDFTGGLVDSALATEVYEHGIILGAELANNIAEDASTGEAIATALTPYLAETVGGATIEQIQNYFNPQFTILGGKLDQGNSVLQGLSDSLTEKIWSTPISSSPIINYANGSYSAIGATNISPLAVLRNNIANSVGYGLTNPVLVTSLSLLSESTTSEFYSQVGSSTKSPLQALLDNIMYADLFVSMRRYTPDGVTFAYSALTPDGADARNAIGVVTGITNRFGSGTVTTHEVTDEGIETTDTTYDTIIGALTAATNDTNNLLSGLSYIFAAPSDIKLKQDTVAEQQEVTDAVFGDEGIISGEDYGSATDVVSQLGGLADTGVTVSDVAAAVNSSEATSWFSSEVRASLDTTVTTYARGEAPEVHNPFAAGSIYDITTIIGGD